MKQAEIIGWLQYWQDAKMVAVDNINAFDQVPLARKYCSCMRVGVFSSDLVTDLQIWRALLVMRGTRPEWQESVRDDGIAPGNIFFLGWGTLPREKDSVECLKCGGYAEEVDSTEEEVNGEFNCGRPWACCCAAFVCRKCGARMVGKRDAPEVG